MCCALSFGSSLARYHYDFIRVCLSFVFPSAYLFFKGGRFDDAVDVEFVSDMVPFSSSRCTAIEKRRQNCGSRTPPIVE